MIYSKQLFADNTNDSVYTTTTVPTDGPAVNNEPSKDDAPKQDAPKEHLFTEQEVNERIDKIINRKYAKWAEKKDREISEAKKLAEMDATQKAEYERDKLQAELDSLKKAQARADLEKQARKVLQADGLEMPDEIINLLVTDDAETTNTALQSFVTVFNDAVNAQVERSLKHGAPKTGAGQTALTKEQILKVANPKERQKLIAENLDLFK